MVLPNSSHSHSLWDAGRSDHIRRLLQRGVGDVWVQKEQTLFAVRRLDDISGGSAADDDDGISRSVPSLLSKHATTKKWADEELLPLAKP